MTKVFDNRIHHFIATNFDELPLGAYYQDEDGDINIKTGDDVSLYYNAQFNEWYLTYEQAGKEVIPLKASVTIEYRKDNEE